MRHELSSMHSEVFFQHSKIFHDVPTGSPVIVAVSGGSDSLCLLHLAHAWSLEVGVELVSVTIDHGLRPEAAAEAAFVAGVCEGLKIPHYTLAWVGKKPTSGISQAARKARYLLMSEFAEDIGARTILTGHTCNDQAETIWMRNSRDGGHPQLRGLSGISKMVTLSADVSVCRPLLGYGRKQLRAYLREIGQPWIEDPSNDDISYERVRARRALESSDVTIPEICRFAQMVGRQRGLVSHAAAGLLNEDLHIGCGQVFSIPKHSLLNCPKPIATTVIQVLVALAGGREHFISNDLASNILEQTDENKCNAGYAIIECDASSVRVYRENRRLETLEISSGNKAVWDNRLIIENTGEQSYVCKPLNSELLSDYEADHGSRFDVLPRAALLSMPVLLRSDGFACLPYLHGFEHAADLKLESSFPALEHYCSQHDLPLLEIAHTVKQSLRDEKITRST